MYSIKKITVESIIEASKNVFPQEFFSMLGGKNEVITELVIVPAIYGENFSSYRLDLVPFDRTIIGTVHSHPSRNNSPSKADINSFKKTGKIHLIIAYPYTAETIAAFDENGKETTIKIIE